MTGVLKKRSKIIFSIRKFFFSNDYTEVETPVRLPCIIPEDHIDPIESEEWFLQSSPEICMKRLLARGHQKIFQICKAFRKGERGSMHIPEMTMLEWYQVGKNYLHLMDETQDLILSVCKDNRIDEITRDGKTTTLNKPFEKLSVYDAIKKYTNYSYEAVVDNFDEIFGIEICPQLGFGTPVFLYDFPSSQASLAKISDNDPRFAQRFELFISGVEISNCFTELTDHNEQRRRFNKTIKNRQARHQSISALPEKFLEEMPQMPESSGNALGIDRLVMLLLNQDIIDHVLTFTPENL